MDWLDFCWIDLNTKKKVRTFPMSIHQVRKDCNFLRSCTLPLSILSRQVWGHTSWTNALDPLTSSQGSTLAASRKTNTLPYLPVLQKIGSKTPLDMQSYFIGCCGASWIKFDIKTFLKCMILPLLWEKTSIAESIAISSISGCTMKPILKIYMWEARNGARMET